MVARSSGSRGRMVVRSVAAPVHTCCQWLSVSSEAVAGAKQTTVHGLPAAVTALALTEHVSIWTPRPEPAASLTQPVNQHLAQLSPCRTTRCTRHRWTQPQQQPRQQQCACEPPTRARCQTSLRIPPLLHYLTSRQGATGLRITHPRLGPTMTGERLPAVVAAQGTRHRCWHCRVV